MILSPRVSSRCEVPDCGTRCVVVFVKASMNPLTVISAFGAWLAPTPKVEFAGTAKSTWNSRPRNQVDRQVAGVRPQSKLGVIAEKCWVRRIHLQGVEEPASADGVTGLRHSDALKK